jgi:hypothetical protein
MLKYCTTTLLTLSIGACATTPGAQPQDMSAAQHEAIAANQETSAQVHAAQYNPDASVSSELCNTEGDCRPWPSNPTAEHLNEAKKYQKMAADHRAGSQALRDAEARACAGLADADRDTTPFAHREDIASVEPLTVNVASGKGQSARIEGAVITFRALPGMTAQWLQRDVDCHLARNAVLGHDMPEMAYCPLVPKNVTARVIATDTGFAVAVRSADAETATEILRRARALQAR